MGCLNVNGISRECNWALAGIKSSVWISNSVEITATWDTTGQITGATKSNTGATFYEFQQEPQTASFNESLAVGTLFVSQTGSFTLAGMTQAKIETLNTLALSNVQMIVKGNDGNWYWIGHDGSGLRPAIEKTSGVADTDSANVVITLTGVNKGFASTVAVSALAALGIVL